MLRKTKPRIAGPPKKKPPRLDGAGLDGVERIQHWTMGIYLPAGPALVKVKIGTARKTLRVVAGRGSPHTRLRSDAGSEKKQPAGRRRPVARSQALSVGQQNLTTALGDRPTGPRRTAQGATARNLKSIVPYPKRAQVSLRKGFLRLTFLSLLNHPLSAQTQEGS